MVRTYVAIVALLTLMGSTVMSASVARAQSATGGSAVDRCIAKCKQGGTWKHCDKWCEDRARR
jgi:hypothetical protein